MKGQRKQKNSAPDGSARVRDVFRRAAGKDEPDVRSLVEAVPELMRKARAARAASPSLDAISALVPLASRAIPRLAAAAALLVVASLAIFATARTAEAPRASYESMWLGDDGGSSGEDPLYQAIIGDTAGDENG